MKIRINRIGIVLLIIVTLILLGVCPSMQCPNIFTHNGIKHAAHNVCIRFVHDEETKSWLSIQLLRIGK